MSDLIGRSELIRRIESEYREYGEDYDVEQILGDIEDMQTAYDIDKVVEELENNSFITVKQEEVQTKRKDILSYISVEKEVVLLKDAIEIVKKETWQHNNVIIDGKYCFQSCACTEKCDKCSRLCNGDIDWYENIDNWTEYYNNGWIQCSERLPEEYTVLCCDNYGEMIVGHPYFDEVSNTNYSAESDNEMMYDCVAWRTLPEPFKEGE